MTARELADTVGRMFVWATPARRMNPSDPSASVIDLAMSRAITVPAMAVARVAQGTGCNPNLVQGLGVPTLAAQRGMHWRDLLNRCGVSRQDAVDAGLQAPQREYLDSEGPWGRCIACRCASQTYAPNLMLGALTMNGLFDDLASMISAPFGGSSTGSGTASDGSGTISETYDPGPTAAPSMSDGWPAAPPFRPGNWTFADPTPTYTLATGDTMSGLSRLYLGDPSRWLEIWDLQSFKWTLKPDPSSKNPGRGIKQGDVFVMPYEARDKARQLMQTMPGAPPTPGAPGTKPSAINGLDPSAPGIQNWVTAHKTPLIIGGVALVVIAGVAVAYS